MIRLVFFVLLSFSISSFAQEQEDVDQEREPAAAGAPACNALKDACVKAGYLIKGPLNSEKSIVGGCMAKIARGESVRNLKVKATDPAIEPCINFMKAKMYDMSQKSKTPAHTPPSRAFRRPDKPGVPQKPAKPAGK